MGNLFSRMKQTISADFHDLLDKKEQKNPIGMLNQYLRQCEQETEKVGKLLERQYLLKEEFTREYNQAQNLAEKRKHQAEIAKQSGETDLMEFAIKESQHYEDRALSLKEAHKSAEVQLDELERKYEEMKHKLKDMHLKRLELMGRENIARANNRINRVLDGSSSDAKPVAMFEEMEHYIDRIEHHVHTDFNRHTIDARIVQLEKELEQKEA
ncbi:PspA/IM30 family protein [Peribacillus sp. NJ11]|uniref:PspA/IM30 family protein n=1 Tax=Peribacillus sp. NJ11 TaxID=3055861 RepID=UPI0025A21117|nr:PspA/IM30 family protein [Peribacillus sp. NJ11]MDM5221432.1 PspA/IM30 family protein [Peribacillus sp. NJ11]